MGIFRAIWNFFKGLGCFILGIIIVAFCIGIGALIWFFGPFILLGFVGFLIILGALAAVFGR